MQLNVRNKYGLKVSVLFLLGWIQWLFVFLSKIPFWVLAWTVMPVVVYVCSKLGLAKLPKLFYLWDNKEEGYHAKGRHVTDIKTIDTGVWYYNEKKAQGWSDARIAVMWTCYRNKCRNLMFNGYFSLDVYDKFDIVYEFCTLTGFNKRQFGEYTVRHFDSPFPWRLRAVKDFRHERLTRYLDIVLIRRGIRLYPMVRIINLNKDKTHQEWIFGFKVYRWMWWYRLIGQKSKISEYHRYRTASLNRTSVRDDSQWQ